MANKKILFGVAALLAAFSMSAQAVHRWVDKNGNVHYDDVLPPEAAGQGEVQIQGGVEVKPKEKPAAKETATQKSTGPVDIEQQRHDDALLGTFSNEAEIDLARDRNLQQVNARVNSIQERMKTAKDDMDGYKKEMDSRKTDGKQADKNLQDLYSQAAAKHSKLQDDLAKAQAEAAAIKARYDADKLRFRELKAAGK